jgi:hypothetical protein
MKREVSLLLPQERATGSVLNWTDPANVLARYSCIIRLNIIRKFYDKKVVCLYDVFHACHVSCQSYNVIRLTVRLWMFLLLGFPLFNVQREKKLDMNDE